jgi:hypothetical protein
MPQAWNREVFVAVCKRGARWQAPSLPDYILSTSTVACLSACNLSLKEETPTRLQLAVQLEVPTAFHPINASSTERS